MTFIKGYLTLLISVGLGALFLFSVGIYLILKFFQSVPSTTKKDQPNAQATPLYHPQSEDIAAISGDDPIATQLDLARAYLETNKTQLAKKILDDVTKRGNSRQQYEARTLRVTLQ